MIRVALVEDFQPQIERMTQILKQIQDEEKLSIEISVFRDGETFASYAPHAFDLALLDIQMDKLDGMEAARRVRLQDEEMIIIFITNLAQYAIQGYAVQALDFILKPVNPGQFREKFIKAIRRIEKKQNEKRICVKSGAGSVWLTLSEISFVEIVSRHLEIHTPAQVLCCNDSLQNFEKQLDERFYRCHVAYLVNMDYVRQVGKSTARIDDDGEVLVSKYRRREFMEALTRHLGRTL